MKKTLLCLLTTLMALALAGCSSNAVSVEGTWYSVTDATMYNFQNNEITVSGVTVGQYEDNGDSVVISLMGDGTNLTLYVTTTMDGVDVLADVAVGDGTMYFCKGLENAEKIIADAQQAEKDAEAAAENELRAFVSYTETELFGVWIPDGGSSYEKIEFFDDWTIEWTKQTGEVRSYQLPRDASGEIEFKASVVETADGREPRIVFCFMRDGSSDNPEYTHLMPAEDASAEDRIRINGWHYTKQT